MHSLTFFNDNGFIFFFLSFFYITKSYQASVRLSLVTGLQ